MKKRISPTIKVYFIRGAFYLLLLPAVCVIPFALGQRTGGTLSTAANATESATTSSDSGPAVGALPVPKFPTGGAIYSQYDNPATQPPINIGSQQFEPALNTYDDQAADDFVLSVPQPPMYLYITGVRVMGEYSTGGGPASSFNVYFYMNGPGNLPGTAIYSFLNMPYTGTPPDFVITWTPVAFSFPSGTYWVSVQAVQDFNTNGQWFWHNRTVQSNAGAAWQNPGDGYDTGCITWNRKNACMPDQIWPDQVFQILGFPEGPTPTATATAPRSPTPTATFTPTPIPTATPSPAGCSVVSSSPPCGGIVVGTPPTDFTVNLSAPEGGVQGSVFMVNGTPANSVTVLSGGTQLIFHFDTSPVIEGQNTMHIPACAFPCGEPGGCVYEFTCTFTYQASTPTPTAPSSPTATATATSTATSTPTTTPPPPTPTPRRPTPRPRPTSPPRP